MLVVVVVVVLAQNAGFISTVDLDFKHLWVINDLTS